MDTNIETRIPPYPRGTVQILRAKGHTVTVRMNRNGSFRYCVDGSREMNALQVSTRYGL